jgi:hypothetical protein
MAIDVTSPQAAGSGFVKNATSADASACEEIIAAPGAGTNIIVEYLVISSDSAISITLGEGETGGAVTTALIGPITFAAGQTIAFPFLGRVQGMELSDNESLTVDASGAGNICCWIQGFIK